MLNFGKFISKYCFSEVKNLKVYTKGITFAGIDYRFDLKPIKSRYGVRNNYIVVNNEGVISFDFIPQMRDSQSNLHVDYDRKKSFALSIKDIGNFLEIDEHIDQGFTMSIEYSVKKGLENKKLKLEKNINKNPEQINIILEILTANDSIPDIREVSISLTDFSFIKEIMRQFLPYMLGWNAIGSKEKMIEEIQDDQIKNRMMNLDDDFYQN